MTTPTIRNQLTFSSIEPGKGLKEALGKTRTDVIIEIRESNIRGRGGAGFPTGVKWNLAASAKDDRKYVVCNADEGEPGTFKDRVVLTEWPDLVFEGMTIAAYAIGATKGFLYLRGEYTYLRASLDAALRKRRDAGLLGENAGGKDGFVFDIEIRMGAGAYVCGEETALIESLEGQRGEPRNRPPFPVDTGYQGHATVVNNVETLVWAAAVLGRGAKWFREIGTEKSTGPKLFSISGDVARPGVYEFPFGVTINELLDAAGGEGAKAVQVGGASGKCIPAEKFDRRISFEDLATGGAIIVFGPYRDMLEIAENFLGFFKDESCGQCTPCRIGNVKLLEGVHKLQAGRCPMPELKELIRLGQTMQIASKCGLGQTSPNAFLSIVEHFKSELLGRGDMAPADIQG